MTKRIRIRFSGTVQGVGFRPFICRLAVSLGLAGFVRNQSDGVAVEVEGSEEAVEVFLKRSMEELPPLAEVSDLLAEEARPRGEGSFRIVENRGEGGPKVHISPDIATCAQCLEELFDPENRRYRYPFINCADCGPRLTIVTDVPYGRGNTSMNTFPLCDACRAEYENPRDRRFHAEPNACPVCGPRLMLVDGKGREMKCADPVDKAVSLLRRGSVVAVKSVGGFHLCVDASSDKAIAKLRKRKFREEKPLAVMVKDLGQARMLAHVTPAEERLLEGIERPIVLLKKRQDAPVSELVAPGMAELGVMLPYAPVHHLLLHGGFTALVMTSGNQTDEPVCTGNSEALQRLKGIADCFLMHDRPIIVRCDDSVQSTAMGTPRTMRRSRGYAPRPIVLAEEFPHVLGLGGHLKVTACIVKDNLACMSPHIGDMETPQARDFYHDGLAVIKRITECDPLIVACDMHPDYYTTWLSSQMEEKRVIQVQHHHAHIVSCMAENRISGDVIGLAMDGTGYGLDGKIWGGEFLVADESSFQRAGHVRYFPLPGGDAAVKQPWRVAAALLIECFGSDWQKRCDALRIIPEHISYAAVEAVVHQKIRTVYTSSLGRIFDAVSCLLGIRRQVTFEGQAAMELEAAASRSETRVFAYDVLMDNDIILDLYPAIRQLVEERVKERPVGELAGMFHATLIEAFVRIAGEIRDATGFNRVVLSGGCFQNRILLEGCITALDVKGFHVYTHHLVPANDGGIALGQAVAAAKTR